MAVYTLSNTAIPTTLDEDLTAAELDITLVDGSTYPTADFIIRINLELIDIQSRTGNVLTVRSGGRGYNTTTAVTHSTSDIVEHVLDTADLPFRRTVGSVLWEAQGDLDMQNNDLLSVNVVSSLNTVLSLEALSSTASAQDIYLRADDSGGVLRDRFWIDGDGDISFYKVDGSTVSLLWDESDDQWEFITPVNIAGGLTVDAGTDSTFLFTDTPAYTDDYNLGMDHLPRRMRVTHEQGSFRQAMEFGDAGTADATMFGIGYSSNSGTNWYPRFTVAQSDDIAFYKSGGVLSLLWDNSDDRWEYATQVAIVDDTESLIIAGVTSSYIGFWRTNTSRTGYVGHVATNNNMYLHANDGNVIIRAASSSAASQDVLIYADDAGGAERLRIGVDGNGSLSLYDYNQASRFSVDTFGALVTGRLGGVSDPTAGSHVGDRDYNDARYALASGGPYLPLVGGEMSGNITWSGGSTFYANEGDINLRAQTAGTTKRNIGMYTDDATGTPYNRVWIDGTGAVTLSGATGVKRAQFYTSDISFWKQDGTSLSLQWDESDNRWEMYTNFKHIDGTGVLDDWQTLRNGQGPLYLYSSPSGAGGNMRMYVSDSGGVDRLRQHFTDSLTDFYNLDASFVTLRQDSVGWWFKNAPVNIETETRTVATGSQPLESSSFYVTDAWAQSADQVGYLVLDAEAGLGTDILGVIEVEISGHWNNGNSVGVQTVRTSLRYDHSPTPTVTIFDSEYPVSFSELNDHYKIGPAEAWTDTTEKIRWPIYKLQTLTTSFVSIKVTFRSGYGMTVHPAVHENISWVSGTTVANSETKQSMSFIDAPWLTSPMTANLDMAGYDIVNAQLISGVAANHLQLQAAAGYNVSIRDDLGNEKIRTSTGGDIVFYDDVAGPTMWWDESSSGWKVETTMDFQNNHLWDVGRVTSLVGNLELYAQGDATSANIILGADDTTGAIKVRQRIYGTGDIAFYKVDGSTSWMRWDESADVLGVTAPLHVGNGVAGTDLVLDAFSEIHGESSVAIIADNGNLTLIAERTAAEDAEFLLYLDDGAGVQRKRMHIFGDGDIVFNDNAAATTLLWDESENEWAFETNISLQDFNIYNAASLNFKAPASTDYFYWGANVDRLELHFVETGVLNRSVMTFHGAATTDPGDIKIESPTDGDDLVRWDESADSWVFYKDIDMNGNAITGLDGGNQITGRFLLGGM